MATLSVTHTETITLNGQEFGGTNTYSVTGINEVDKSIITCTTDKVEILGFIASGVAKGSFIEANVRYMRFTNLDTSNHAVLFFTNESSDEVAIKLDKGQTFLWNPDLAGGVVDNMDANSGGAASSGQLADITKVSVQTDTASLKLEILVATT
tara:strand:+ start:18 stop:476 length:459 start_codon:yes stop_codon:yes gene_type:complete